MSQETSNSQPVKQSEPKSATMVALFVFFLSNFILNVMLLQGPSKYMDTNLAQSRDVYAFAESAAQKPDVAFFGSSVVEVPLALMDDKDEYVSIAKTAQAELSDYCKTKKSVYVYAIEAGLISDQLLIFNRLLEWGKLGKHNVLAVTPRDFGDSRIPAKNLSDTYRSLLLPGDFDLLPLYHDSFIDWTDYILTRTVYIYKNKSTLSNYIKGFFAGVETSILGLPASIAQEKPTDQERFQNTLNEYVQVYDYLEKNDSLKIQTAFLERLVSFCKKQNVEIILVNLPLTAENRALMKPGFYDKFSDTLKKIALENSTTYIDFSSDPKFAGHDVFHDSAHLNKLGGKRLIESLAPQLCRTAVDEGASSR
ncbi:MAG: DUF1574 family protein [Candidatus Melainabacteria bacterium]|nr:DUF1574 family protein [Candidatus Melainabacteria bacterium]